MDARTGSARTRARHGSKLDLDILGAEMFDRLVDRPGPDKAQIASARRRRQGPRRAPRREHRDRTHSIAPAQTRVSRSDRGESPSGPYRRQRKWPGGARGQRSESELTRRRRSRSRDERLNQAARTTCSPPTQCRPRRQDEGGIGPHAIRRPPREPQLAWSPSIRSSSGDCAGEHAATTKRVPRTA